MMKPVIELRTKDSDLGLTLLLWLADFVAEFLSAESPRKIIVSDEGRIGRPFRNSGFCKGSEDFKVRCDEDETVHLICSSSAIFLPRQVVLETFNKALSRLGIYRDTISLDHLQVVRQQRKIREMSRRALKIKKNEAKCRFLLRVDDFPSRLAPSENFLQFHAIARESGLPYLLAVTPFFGQSGESRYFSDKEIEILHQCINEGAELALHGFSHQSRYSNYASELTGMPVSVLRQELERSEEYLRKLGLAVIGFVPPFNAFDPFTLSVLTERYRLLCGGPESVLSLGYRAGPSFLMQSIYVPSYRYAYDVNFQNIRHLDKMIQEAEGMPVPITLHWANEVKTNFRSFRTLCSRLVGRTMAWKEFLSLVDWVKSLQKTRNSVKVG